MSPIPSVRLTSIPTAVPVGRVHDKTLQEIAAWQPLELPELRDEMRRVRGDGGRPIDATAAAREILSEAVQSPNAAQALEAFAEAQARGLSADPMQALVLGVARPRSAMDEGRRGILSAGQAKRAARRIASLAPADRRRLQKLLSAAKQPAGFEPDPIAEQGLILKALAARPELDKQAWSNLVQFAASIHGMPRYALMRTTTLLDIDHGRNTSRPHLDGMDDTHPTAAPRTDTQADNDGLLQIYDSSCGPAAAEILRAEADPAYALAVHGGSGPQSLLRGGISDELQRAWLVHFGDPPRRRRGLYDYKRLKTKCSKLVTAKELSSKQRLAVLHFCRTPEARKTDAARQAIAIVRRNGKFPTGREVERMQRAHPAQKTLGTATEEMEQILQQMVTPSSGTEFASRALRGGHFSKKDLEAFYTSCRQGWGAILGTSDHWWSVVDARSDDDGRRYLFHDSWTGITAWVDEHELKDGAFQNSVFEWGKSAHCDTLILGSPVATGAANV